MFSSISSRMYLVGCNHNYALKCTQIFSILSIEVWANYVKVMNGSNFEMFVIFYIVYLFMALTRNRTQTVQKR